VPSAARRYLIPLLLLALTTAAAGAIRRARPTAAGVRFGLDALPLEAGGYRGRALAAPENVYQYLEADEMLARVYVNPEETNTVKLTIVFARGWRALHSQRACLTNQGWTVIEDGALDIPQEDGRSLHATRLLLERSGSRIVVLYMFVTGESTTGSWFLHSARMALGGSRRGGALLVAVAPTDSPEADSAAQDSAEGILREAARFMQHKWESEP